MRPRQRVQHPKLRLEMKVSHFAQHSGQTASPQDSRFMNYLCAARPFFTRWYLRWSRMLAIIIARILETVFLIGVIGSAVVVLWTFVEDVQDLGPDEPMDNERSLAAE